MSKTMEYSANDHAIALLARGLGKVEDADRYTKDRETGGICSMRTIYIVSPRSQPRPELILDRWYEGLAAAPKTRWLLV